MTAPDLVLAAVGSAAIPGIGGEGLTVVADLDLPLPAAAGAGELLAVSDGDGHELLRLALRRSGCDPARDIWDRERENYPRWAGPDGTTAVLEAEVAVAIRPPFRAHLPRRMRVGVPLALVGDGRRTVAVRMRSGKVDLVVDGRLVDEEWPCGPLDGVPARLRLAGGVARVWRSALPDAAIATGALDHGGGVDLRGDQLQYWTPPGHNRWAGDTMLCHDGERLHLFYLIDRRHHGSKGFCGAHQIAHFSTGDLAAWRGHPLALAVEEPWEAIGTGSMVKHAGRWHFIYGLHSGRCVTDAGAGGDLPRRFADIAGTPEGTAIAVSDDGIAFRKQEELVQPAQNPSVFPDPAGGFCLFAGEGAYGLYRSDDLRHWRAVDHAIVPYGPASPARNTCECMCHLAWGGWHYLFGGFTGFWMARDIAGPYWDQDGPGGAAAVAAIRDHVGDGMLNPRPAGTPGRPRWDIYDGLSVPMAAAMPDGRRILAGWLQDLHGWAGCLVLRELLQEADGTLALRWPPECVPRTGPAVTLGWDRAVGDRIVLDATDGPAAAISDRLPAECLIEVDVEPAPGAGPYAVVVADGLIDGCELRLDPQRRIAQWGRVVAGRPAPDLPAQAEVLAAMGPGSSPYDRPSPHVAHKAGDFAIGGVEGLAGRFTLRLLVIEDRKSGSVILDAEIAGRRTLITRRRGLSGCRLQLLATRGIVVFSLPRLWALSGRVPELPSRQ